MPVNKRASSTTLPGGGEYYPMIEQSGIHILRAQFFSPILLPGGFPVRQLDRTMQALRHPAPRMVGRSLPDPRER